MKQYCTVQDIENFGVDLDGFSDKSIENLIESISLYIDNTARQKIVETEEETRTFFSDYSNELIVDTCHDITSILSAGEEQTEHQLFPFNKKYTKSIFFPYVLHGGRKFEVTAKFGMFEEIPEDIKFICTVMVIGVINNINGIGEKKKSETIGNYSVSYETKEERLNYRTAQNMLKKYTRVTL